MITYFFGLFVALLLLLLQLLLLQQLLLLLMLLLLLPPPPLLLLLLLLTRRIKSFVWFPAPFLWRLIAAVICTGTKICRSFQTIPIVIFTGSDYLPKEDIVFWFGPQTCTQACTNVHKCLERVRHNSCRFVILSSSKNKCGGAVAQETYGPEKYADRQKKSRLPFSHLVVR